MRFVSRDILVVFVLAGYIFCITCNANPPMTLIIISVIVTHGTMQLRCNRLSGFPPLLLELELEKFGKETIFSWLGS